MPEQVRPRRVERACQQCGFVFRARQRKGGYERFCSTPCVNEGKRRTRELVCVQCGVHFEVRASIAKPGRRFCKRLCRTAFNRGLGQVLKRITRRAYWRGACLHHGYKLPATHTGHAETLVGGYGHIGLHRFVYMMAHDLTFEGMEKKVPVVRHTCDHGWCIEPTHLIDGSVRENVQDTRERRWLSLRYGEPMSIGQGAQPAPMALGIVGLAG